MVVDLLENLDKYASLHPLFPEAFKYIQSCNLQALEPGKFELKGKEIMVNVSQTSPKAQAEAKLETHNEYIDIQIPLSGVETMGYTPAKRCTSVSVPYNAEKDITFFEGASEVYVPVTPDMFVLFFPEDGHAPGITPGGVKKIIIKVKL